MEKYLEAIRENVCSICVDSDEKGKCRLNEREICAVEYFLPKIISVVHSTDSPDIEDYFHNLREEVCSKCRDKEEKNNCYLREDSNCSLDRYFHLIVSTIKKVDASV